MANPIYYNTDIRGNIEDGSRFKAMTHNWDLVVSVPPMGLANDFNELLNGKGEGQHLNINCQSVSLPNTNISTVEGNVRGVRFHQIQTRASTQIQTNLLFFEPHDYPIYRFFELWKTTTVQRSNAAQNPAARIKNGVKIVLYNTDRKDKVLEYVLYDTYCGAAQISDPNASGAFQTVTATLISSNYGIIAYDAGAKTFSTAENENGYLGTEGKWVSTLIQGTEYKTDARSVS